MSERDQRRDPRVQTKQGVWMEGQDAKALNMSKSGMFIGVFTQRSRVRRPAPCHYRCLAPVVTFQGFGERGFR